MQVSGAGQGSVGELRAGLCLGLYDVVISGIESGTLNFGTNA